MWGYCEAVEQSHSKRRIEVVDYSAEWPNAFEYLRQSIWPHLSDCALSIDHVGSTSVPGLAAKPVLDIDVITGSKNEVPLAVERLTSLGYAHRGDLGIPDREAFFSPADGPRHHLYVCPAESLALRNHLTLRNHLRTHPADVAAYSFLKKRLAREFPDDAAAYMEGKSEFILAILAQYGFSREGIESIRIANRR